MELLQAQVVIEKIFHLILSHGPQAIESLKTVLAFIVAGGHTVEAIYYLIVKYPVLVEVITQLLALINASASLAEIVGVLMHFITSGAIPFDAVLQFLQILLPIIVGGGAIGI